MDRTKLLQPRLRRTQPPPVAIKSRGRSHHQYLQELVNLSSIEFLDVSSFHLVAVKWKFMDSTSHRIRKQWKLTGASSVPGSKSSCGPGIDKAQHVRVEVEFLLLYSSLWTRRRKFRSNQSTPSTGKRTYRQDQTTLQEDPAKDPPTERN
ncbi:hypothetical protein PHYPSEUDO_012684 [Phytophthora pseudosyringae]|uniref:Uncharacterized protein n=1 Tax=Phytophthora pseudosyringae TaxID=221518 RepID=A0A8T1V9P2_9STRA|nr:hypothetical protein PHYPSEUDO_012684 [Phytophthora pseudosyringae]